MSTTHPSTSQPQVRILIINPNTSTSMTEALKPAIESLKFPSVQYTYFTCPDPKGIKSINSPHDAYLSAQHCLPHLRPLLATHDAFLVACYSHHPLVPWLKIECGRLSQSARQDGDQKIKKYVTGIFEASVLVCLGLLNTQSREKFRLEGGGKPSDEIEKDGQKFGIVSTGSIWEEALADAVRVFLGSASNRFAGCETTGLDASELHELPAEEVRGKMMEATKRLMERESGVNAICLGCAGMVGLEEAVRTACVEVLGKEKGEEVHIVDGVKAGVGILYGMARGGF